MSTPFSLFWLQGTGVTRARRSISRASPSESIEFDEDGRISLNEYLWKPSMAK